MDLIKIGASQQRKLGSVKESSFQEWEKIANEAPTNN